MFPWGAVIGGGAGILSSLFGGGNRNTLSYDPRTQAYLDAIRSRGLGQFDRYSAGANLGLSALSGDAGAYAKLASPYDDTLNPFFDQLRAGAVTNANKASTVAGAFGGGRAALMAGAERGNVDNAQAQQRYQSFLDTMQRAQGLAGLGLSAYGQLPGATGPAGYSTQGPRPNWFTSAVGGAVTGSALFPGSGRQPSYADANGSGTGSANPANGCSYEDYLAGRC